MKRVIVCSVGVGLTCILVLIGLSYMSYLDNGVWRPLPGTLETKLVAAAFLVLMASIMTPFMYAGVVNAPKDTFEKQKKAR